MTGVGGGRAFEQDDPGNGGRMSTMDQRANRPVIVVPEAMLRDIVVVPEGESAEPFYVREVDDAGGDNSTQSFSVRFERFSAKRRS